MATTANEVIDSFEASFQDKKVIPFELEIVWLKKAIGRYCIEMEEISLNEETLEFETDLSRYTIDTLGAFMKQSYQEREVSKVNKRISIVGKDLSIDGNNGSKTAARAELEYDRDKSEFMLMNLMTPAYN